MEIQKKSCGNCKYFLRHYVKSNISVPKFKPLDFGHCTNDGVHKKEKFALKSTECAFWENSEELKRARTKKIKSVLRDMAENIENIALILGDDAE